MVETYTKDEVLAIFAAIGSKIADRAQLRRRQADSIFVEDREAIPEANALDCVQYEIFAIINQLTDGTDPQTI